jgi:hypothetical protein
VQCIGTVVNQNRPLCNIGLVMKSYADGMLSMTLGAWLVFTETYTGILDAALLGPSNSVSIEWVDDAFFGYICSAKDMLGQATAILTSTIGAGMITAHKKVQSYGSTDDLSSGAMREVSDDAFTASVTMVLNGVNSLMYQIVLLPLYTLIAMQKTVVCTASDLFGIIDATGFKINIGKKDMQKASDVSSGVCLTQMFEEQVRAPCVFSL